MSTTKRKRVSKKNKAAWRKHTDIKDIEDFLEDQRLEERIGKAETKKDEELFAVDVGKDEKKKNLISKRLQRRKQKAERPPRSLTALENTSKVEDPIVKRNHVKKQRIGRDVISHILAGKKSSRITQALRDSKKYSLQRRKEKREKEHKIFRNNLWDELKGSDDENEFKSDWITKELATYHLQKTGQRFFPRPGTADLKTTRATALELPHPGMSYNPSLKSHQDLLNEVIERESKIIKEEQHLKRVTTDMFSKLTREERDLHDLKEAAAGIVKDEDEKEEEVDSEDLGRISINPPVKNKKKDLKSRRKQREQRDLLQERKKIKLEKKKITDLHRLRAIKVEITEEEKKTRALMRSRKRTAEERKYKPRRLAKLKFQEPEIPVSMISDLSGNLRNLKTDASVLVDRFKSMQRRNILAPSVDIGIRKRAKIKRFVRVSHKEEQKPLPRKKKKN